MMALNIPEQLEKDFIQLAMEKKIPADNLMMTALINFLEEQDDIRAAEEAIGAIETGEKFHSLDEVRRELGLDS
jgi:predicted DNA-binding protein